MLYGTTSRARSESIVSCLDNYLLASTNPAFARSRSVARELLVLALEIALEEAKGSTTALSLRDEYHRKSEAEL